MDSYDLFGEDVGGGMLDGLAELGSDNFEPTGAAAAASRDQQQTAQQQPYYPTEQHMHQESPLQKLASFGGEFASNHLEGGMYGGSAPTGYGEPPRPMHPSQQPYHTAASASQRMMQQGRGPPPTSQYPAYSMQQDNMYSMEQQQMTDWNYSGMRHYQQGQYRQNVQQPGYQQETGSAAKIQTQYGQAANQPMMMSHQGYQQRSQQQPQHYQQMYGSGSNYPGYPMHQQAQPRMPHHVQYQQQMLQESQYPQHFQQQGMTRPIGVEVGSQQQQYKTQPHQQQQQQQQGNSPQYRPPFPQLSPQMSPRQMSPRPQLPSPRPVVSPAKQSNLSPRHKPAAYPPQTTLQQLEQMVMPGSAQAAQEYPAQYRGQWPPSGRQPHNGPDAMQGYSLEEAKPAQNDMRVPTPATDQPTASNLQDFPPRVDKFSSPSHLAQTPEMSQSLESQQPTSQPKPLDTGQSMPYSEMSFQNGSKVDDLMNHSDKIEMPSTGGSIGLSDQALQQSQHQQPHQQQPTLTPQMGQPTGQAGSQPAGGYPASSYPTDVQHMMPSQQPGGQQSTGYPTPSDQQARTPASMYQSPISHQQEMAALQQQLQEAYCMPPAPDAQVRIQHLQERINMLQHHEANDQCVGGPHCLLQSPMWQQPPPHHMDSLIQRGSGKVRGRVARAPRKPRKKPGEVMDSMRGMVGGMMGGYGMGGMVGPPGPGMMVGGPSLQGMVPQAPHMDLAPPPQMVQQPPPVAGLVQPMPPVEHPIPQQPPQAQPPPPIMPPVVQQQPSPLQHQHLHQQPQHQQQQLQQQPLAPPSLPLVPAAQTPPEEEQPAESAEESPPPLIPETPHEESPSPVASPAPPEEPPPSLAAQEENSPPASDEQMPLLVAEAPVPDAPPPLQPATPTTPSQPSPEELPPPSPTPPTLCSSPPPELPPPSPTPPDSTNVFNFTDDEEPPPPLHTEGEKKKSRKSREPKKPKEAKPPKPPKPPKEPKIKSPRAPKTPKEPRKKREPKLSTSDSPEDGAATKQKRSYKKKKKVSEEVEPVVPPAEEDINTTAEPEEITEDLEDVEKESEDGGGDDVTPKKSKPKRERPGRSKSKKQSSRTGSRRHKKSKGTPVSGTTGAGNDSDGQGSPLPSPDDDTNKRRSARNTQRKKYVDDIMLSISDEENSKMSSPKLEVKQSLESSTPGDQSVKPNFVYVNTTDEDSMVVQTILALRKGTREVKVEEKAPREKEEEVKEEDGSEKPDVKEIRPEGSSAQAKTVEVEEYYVKYRNFSYLHCEWKTEEELYKGDKRIAAKIKRFKQKMAHQTNIFENLEEDPFNPDYVEVERVLDVSEQTDPNTGQTVKHYLVKWRALQYEDSTWELQDDVDPAKIEQFERFRKIPPKEQLKPKKKPTSKEWVKLDVSPVYKNDNTLRDYQLEGLNWLLFSWYNGRNCILADEMGLGKTIQSLTFIHAVYEYGIRGPFLVIAPLSTIPNWQREFEAWTDLNVAVYHGSAASRNMLQEYELYFRNEKGVIMKDVPKINVLITTFEIIITDIQDLKDFNWRICVIDEAHRLKNRNCKLLEGLRTLNLEHRVLLSGTPLQNNVNELFSLLNFLEPQQFNSCDAFLQEFGALKTETEVQKLQLLLKPMMLRRLKEDVEKTLAPKEETVVEVELTNIQKKYYRGILERNFSFLSKGTSSANVPNLMNTMMELRKCCIHPYLLNGAEDQIQHDYRQSHGEDPDAYYKALIQSSGKMVLIDKLLPKLKDNGHRVLIFSQMVRCLDILEDYLMFRKYPFERIDGRIRGNMRQAAIDRFCKPDSDRFVFLLCTKAGGLGINLTAADTVIIYDSDWNPQNDLQAQARCHRIGQQKMVKVYRLLCRNTYEREMFDKASLKLGLDKAILQSMNTSQGGKDPNANKQLSKKEIEDLLKKGAYGAIMDEDNAADKFCEEDIDQILERRTQVITLESEKGSTFSKASFTQSGIRHDIDIDDPDFWKKWAKKADIDTSERDEQSELLLHEPRRRTQIKRYGHDDAVMDISDLESSASGGGESDNDNDASMPIGRSGRRVKNKLKRTKFRLEDHQTAKEGDPSYGTWARSECFKVERGLLTFGWGRWQEILSQSQFREGWRESDIEECARVIILYCLRFYRGDDKIRTFIWELITPPENGEHVPTTQAVNTIPRGRKAVSRRLKARDGLGASGASIVDEYSDHWSRQERYDGDIFLETNYRKHLSRHANKLLLRVRMLYYIKHEIIGDLVQNISDGTHVSALGLTSPHCDQSTSPAPWWDRDADKSLVVGTYKHGYEGYSRMRADPSLSFLALCGPPNSETNEEMRLSDEDDGEGSSIMGRASEGSQASSSQPATPTDPSKPLWPSMIDLNHRLRRVINSYQRNFKKEELKLAQKAKAVSAATLAGALEGAGGHHPSPAEITALMAAHGWDWHQLALYLWKLERREKYEQMARERERQKLEVNQRKWSKREEQDFYRTVSSYGVDFNRHKKKYEWTKFRSLARLDKKFDDTLTEYYLAFSAMCKRVCGIKPSIEEESVDLLVEPVSEERARRTLERIALLSKIREEILSHPKLDERLTLCQPSADTPDWWQPGLHDKDLLIGVSKHGLGRTDIYILNDPDLSFYAITQKNVMKGSEPSVKVEKTEDFLNLDKNEIVVKLEKGEGTLKIEKVGVKTEDEAKIKKEVVDSDNPMETVAAESDPAATETTPPAVADTESTEVAEDKEETAVSKEQVENVEEEEVEKEVDKNLESEQKISEEEEKMEVDTPSETVSQEQKEDKQEDEEEKGEEVQKIEPPAEPKESIEEPAAEAKDEEEPPKQEEQVDGETTESKEPTNKESEEMAELSQPKSPVPSMEMQEPKESTKEETKTEVKADVSTSVQPELEKFKALFPELEVMQKLPEIDTTVITEKSSLTTATSSPAPSATASTSTTPISVPKPSLDSTVAQIIAHSYQNHIKWPKEHALQVRLEHIVHAVERGEWPVSTSFSAYSECGTSTEPGPGLVPAHLSHHLHQLAAAAAAAAAGADHHLSTEHSEVITITTDHGLRPHHTPSHLPPTANKRKRHIAIDVETERAKLHALLNSTNMQMQQQQQQQQQQQHAMKSSPWDHTDESLSEDSRRSTPGLQPPPAHQQQSTAARVLSLPFDLTVGKVAAAAAAAASRSGSPVATPSSSANTPSGVGVLDLSAKAPSAAPPAHASSGAPPMSPGSSVPLDLAQDFSLKNKQLPKSKLDDTLNKLMQRKNCPVEEPVVGKEKKRRKLDEIVLGLSAAKEQMKVDKREVSPSVTVTVSTSKPGAGAGSSRSSVQSASPSPKDQGHSPGQPSTPLTAYLEQQSLLRQQHSLQQQLLQHHQQQLKHPNHHRLQAPASTKTYDQMIADITKVADFSAKMSSFSNEAKVNKWLADQSTPSRDSAGASAMEAAAAAAAGLSTADLLAMRRRRPRVDPTLLDWKKLTGDENVSVINRLTGKKLTGSKAPQLKRLAQWLLENPMYDVDPKWAELVKERGNLPSDLAKRVNQAGGSVGNAAANAAAVATAAAMGSLQQATAAAAAAAASKKGPGRPPLLSSPPTQGSTATSASSSSAQSNLPFPSLAGINPALLSLGSFDPKTANPLLFPFGGMSSALGGLTNMNLTNSLFANLASLGLPNLAGMESLAGVSDQPGTSKSKTPLNRKPEQPATSKGTPTSSSLQSSLPFFFPNPSLLYSPLGLGGINPFSLQPGGAYDSLGLLNGGLSSASSSMPRSSKAQSSSSMSRVGVNTVTTSLASTPVTSSRARQQFILPQETQLLESLSRVTSKQSKQSPIPKASDVDSLRSLMAAANLPASFKTHDKETLEALSRTSADLLFSRLPQEQPLKKPDELTIKRKRDSGPPATIEDVPVSLKKMKPEEKPEAVSVPEKAEAVVERRSPSPREEPATPTPAIPSGATGEPPPPRESLMEVEETRPEPSAAPTPEALMAAPPVASPGPPPGPVPIPPPPQDPPPPSNTPTPEPPPPSSPEPAPKEDETAKPAKKAGKSRTKKGSPVGSVSDIVEKKILRSSAGRAAAAAAARQRAASLEQTDS